MKQIKVFFLIVLSVLALCCCSACGSCTGATGEPEQKIEIALNLHTADVSIGGRVTLKATVEGSATEVVWSSSNESVATVNKGVVYGVSSGTAVITAAIGEVKQSCTVNVSGGNIGNGLQEVPVLHFELSAEKIWIGYIFAPSATLKLSGEPVEAEISFISSDVSVAKIENGQIVGVSEGTATITASCQYDGELYQKTATIEVVAND